MQYKTTTTTTTTIIQAPLDKRYFVVVGLTHLIIGMTFMICSGILIVFSIRSVLFHFS